MEKKCQLTQAEKIEANILRISGISLLLVIAKGVYNDANNIDENYFLLPAMVILAGIFSIVYCTNAFTSGNIVRRWALQDIFNRIAFFIRKKGKVSEEKASILSTRLFGILGLCAWPGLYLIFKLTN